MRPELIAHRGEPANYPENSLPGFMTALRAGARYLETDVQISRDGVPVLSHDPSLLKISGHECVITSTDYDTISKLPAGYAERFGTRFTDLHIARLDEFATLLGRWPQARAFVELKQASLEAHGVERVIEIVLDTLTDVSTQCIIISFESGALSHTRGVCDLPLGWVLPEWSDATHNQARELEPEYLFCNRKRLPPPGGEALWTGSWRWTVYTINDPAEVPVFEQRGFDMLETDVITRLLAEPGLGGNGR